MAGLLDVCRFTPTASGAGTWTVSAAVTGYQTPASAGAVTGATYRYRAESSDLSQWEIGYGIYTVAGTTLTRATIIANSSGGTSAINFTSVPQVAIVALAEDLLPAYNGPDTMMVNGQIIESHAANAATYTLQTLNGVNPSAADPVFFVFKSQTGTMSVVAVTAALSITIPSTTTIGTVAATTSPIYIYAINNAGAVELAVSLKYFGAYGNVTTVAIAAGATSTTMYSTAARAAKDYLSIAVAYQQQATAGTWVTAPTSIQLAPFPLKSYQFNYTLSGNQAGVVISTNTKVNLNQATFTDNDSAFSTGTGKFVAQEPGRYYFSGCASSNGGFNSATLIRKNNTTTLAIAATASATAGAAESTIADLIVGDFIELYFFENAGADAVFAGVGYTWLAGEIVR